MAYLDSLERRLEAEAGQWDEPPMEHPVAWDPTRIVESTTPTVTIPRPTRGTTDPTAKPSASWGRFALFHDEEEDEREEESTSDDDDHDDDDDDEPRAPPQDRPAAGYHSSRNSNDNNNDDDTLLSRRRLLIRIATSQSELYACRASHMPPVWNDGAADYQVSLQKIHYALELADSECALLLQSHGHIPPVLLQDAQIVHVAIDFLTTECDKFRRAVIVQEECLLQKLRPQWQARDNIRSKMGQDRWSNNPNPNNRYAEIRKEDERQLRVVQATLKQLDDLDTDKAQASAKLLQERVLMREQQQQQQQRYNGIRPRDLSRRVSLEDYPDPTVYGWTFTGSHDNVVEFFERAQQNDVVYDEDVVKLDWYFSTATVKTSLHHPTQGKTQLFGKEVSPVVYRQVLMNPRTHTNVRYQTTSN